MNGTRLLAGEWRMIVLEDVELAVSHWREEGMNSLCAEG